MSDSIKFNHEQIRNWWDKQAKDNPESAGMLSVYGSDRVSKAYRKWAEWSHFLQLVSLKPTMRVLELGCGAGRWAMDISPLVRKVVGVDFSGEMIEIGREQVSKAGLSNIELEVGSAAEYHSNETFDVIYLSGVDQFLDEGELPAMLSRVRQMLAPNGLLIDRVTLSLEGSQFIEKENGYQCYYRSKKDLLSAMKSAGFECHYHAPSHQQLQLGWLGKNRWCMKQVSSLVRRSPGIICPFLHKLSMLIGKISPVKQEAKPRSHDFLVFK